MQHSWRLLSARRMLVETDRPFLVFTKSKSCAIVIIIIIISIRKYIHVFVLIVSLIKKINLVIPKQRSGSSLLFRIIGEITTSWFWTSTISIFRFDLSRAGESSSKLACDSAQASRKLLPAVYEPCCQSTNDETSYDTCPVDSFCRRIHLVTTFGYSSQSATNENMNHQLGCCDRCCESKY